MIDFRLYGITDRKQCASVSPGRHIRALCASGLRALQLREKDLQAAELFELAGEIRKATLDHGTLLFINDRVDIAMAVGADGVHCTEGSIPPDEVKSLDSSLLVGASIHTTQAASDAERSGADFLLFGPVFQPASKEQKVKGQGLDRLASVCEAVQVPVLAVGGIEPGNSRQCLANQAAGVAAISSLMNANDVVKRLGEFKTELEGL